MLWLRGLQIRGILYGDMEFVGGLLRSNGVLIRFRVRGLRAYEPQSLNPALGVEGLGYRRLRFKGPACWVVEWSRAVSWVLGFPNRP